MNTELFSEGCLIMCIGMGFVFFFLCAMIWVMNFSAVVLRWVAKFMPEEIVEDKYTSKKKVTKADDTEIAIAIACAVAEGSR